MSSIARGQTPSVASVAALAAYLGVSTSDLVGDAQTPAELAPLADAWAEEHLDGDEYEAIFGAVVENDTKVSVNYRLSVTTVETLKRRAAEQGVGVSEYLESILAK